MRGKVSENDRHKRKEERQTPRKTDRNIFFLNRETQGQRQGHAKTERAEERERATHIT